MKPLVRWIIGDVKPLGFEVLREAVINFKRLYGDQVDYMVCHNNLSDEKKELLPEGVELYEQYDMGYLIDVETPPNTKSAGGGAAWKLYPPRLRQNAHELILDNDIILYHRPPQLDEFFERDDMFVVTEGLKRNFGNFDHFIPEGLKFNTGFTCLPPNYDFTAALNKLIREAGCTNWTDHFDKQGIVAAAIIQNEYKVISLQEITICLERSIIGDYGVHFVGVNSGLFDPYIQYKEKRVSML